MYSTDSESDSAGKRRIFMTNTYKLRKAIEDSGLKRSVILKRTGIKAYSTLRDKVDNKREFTASEITKLCEVLNLSTEQREAIFFATEGELHSA